MGDSRRRSSYFEPAFAQLERKSRASLLAPTSQTDEEGAQARDVVFEVGETSTLASGMNLVTTMVGAGVLSFPGLFAKGGWIVSPIVLGGSAMALCEIGDVISQVLDWCEQRGYKYPKAYSFGSRPEKYEDMMEVPFGSTGKTITFFAFNAFMVLVSGAYMILIGTSVEYIVRHEYFPYRACVLLMSLIYGPLTLLDNMSLISRMSSIGVVASVMYVVCIACAGLSADRKKVYLGPIGSYDIEWSKIFGGLGQLIAVMLMGFTYQVVVPTVRSEMSQPGDLRTAIYGSIALVTGIYGVAGATGYLGYGQNVEGNVLKNMITVSDPAAPLPVKNPTWPGIFLSIAIVANLSVTIPILLNCVCRAMEARCSRGYNAPMRITIFLIALCVGFFCPYFLEFFGIISSLLCVPITLLMPLAAYWKLQGGDNNDAGSSPSSNQMFKIIKHIIILILALMTMVIGTIGSFSDLFAAIQKSQKGFWEHS